MKDEQLRETFAREAMQGLLSNAALAEKMTPEEVARNAWAIADAMVRERARLEKLTSPWG